MNRPLLAVIAAGAITLAGCGSGSDAPATTPLPATTTAIALSDTGRTSGQPVQVSMFVRALNSANASIGQPAVVEARALDFAASLCDALDAGASTFDTSQIMVEEGFSPSIAGDVNAKAIAAACSEHLS
jgi:hypothetical protein